MFTSPVVRRGAVALCALLAAFVLAAAPVRAEDAAAPAPPPAGAGKHAKQAKQPKSKAKPAVAARPVSKPAAAPKPEPKPKPPARTHEQDVAENGPWASQSNWLCMRAGYTKATSDNSGDGLVGYGIAFQHMLNDQWSFGGSVQHDLLGHLGYSTEIAVPFTLEITRHFKWDTAIRPYVGFGAGYYFHKYYRTGHSDTGAPCAGEYVCFGANLPLNARHVLGMDVRTNFMATRDGVANPVFGTETGNETTWSAKLSWGMVY